MTDQSPSPYSGLIERLKAVRYTRVDWRGPYGAIDLPCDADDDGAIAHPINPAGPEAASAIRDLEAENARLRSEFIHAANALNSALAGKPVRDADEIIHRAALSGRAEP